MTDRNPIKQGNIGWHRAAYWAFLAGAWLVFLPNIIGLKGADGNPWTLWLLSPLLGLVSTGLAIWDKSLCRTLLALLFGVGAVFILNTAALLISGP